MLEVKDSDIDNNYQVDSELTEIVIRGAREHNLKGFDLELPRDKFIVITGLSGSGKSSLAFDTLYAEGQRRYVECLSPYAKQFLGVMKKPDVDSIEGLSPAISIEQKSISHNPRSTVGTTTEIYDYIRLLFARIGVQYCPDCDIPVIQKSSDQIISEILEKYSEKEIIILCPVVRARKGHYKELFETFIKQGFTKVLIDGEIKKLSSGMKLDRYMVHDIDLVIDKLKIDPTHNQRIIESIEFALKKGEGIMSVMYQMKNDTFHTEIYSINNSCPGCSKSFEPLAPNLFSFNSTYGACPKCNGLGYYQDLNREKMIQAEDSALSSGAISIFDNPRSLEFSKILSDAENFLKRNKVDKEKPLTLIPDNILEKLFFGDDESEEQKNIPKKINIDDIFDKSSLKYKGIIPLLRKLLYNPVESFEKKALQEFVDEFICDECNGSRLKKESTSVKIHNRNISHLVNLDISDAKTEFLDISGLLSDRENKISHLIFKEINARLEFLDLVGLSYLTLNRRVNSLSGGESQRIRLASQIGSKLVGITYVLDEPSIGLHQHDNNKLIESLKSLRDLGNTVIVVEHDKAMIQHSDYFVDIGPGAGIHGGEIILKSDPIKLKKLKPAEIDNSLTAQYLLNRKKIEMPKIRREGNGSEICLVGATGNNLKNVTLKLPLGKLVCITGMSGSGKSSLINDTLYPIITQKLNKRSVNVPLPYRNCEGLENIDKVIEIDQSPIGRTPRSNPATYTGIFTIIRDFFAMLPESKIRGYKPGRFSFNVADGRCEECEGAGIKKIEMNFLPDVYVKCDTCDGKRYNSETLTVRYKGKSISDVLDMTVEEAKDFFKDIPKLSKKINTLYDVGLGYITLGQQAPTLSGGEAQRVKLATELSKIGTGKTLYLLDEPTTGLHFEDINLLLKLLQKLVDKGNTVVIIEHNLDVIKCADWIIDLGLFGGKNGGEIIFNGTPEKLIRNRKSLTGKYLKEELKSNG